MNKQLWQTYCQLCEKCRKAKKTGKEYINIQFTKTGGYRLVASRYQGRESCSRLDGFGSSDWASNLMYRLADLHFIDSSQLDAMFDDLERVGHESNALSR